MSNPTFPNISDAEALALSNAVDPGTGIRHVQLNTDDQSSPPLFTRLKQLEHQIFDLLRRFGGAVISLGGLSVGVFACDYRIGAAEKNFAGAATQAVTASTTNYLYLDGDETLKISTSGWPSGDHLRLAKVITGGSDITSIVDCRLHNFLTGIVNDWASVNASADVNVNNHSLKNVLDLCYKDFTELTLSGDTITPTQALHTVDTEGDAAGDNLVTITADAAKIGRQLILRAANAARVVTVKSTGNIALLDGELVLDNLDKYIVLLQDSASTWAELGRNFNSPKQLQQDVDANDHSISGVKLLNLRSGSTLEIVNGAITPTHSTHYLDPEGSANSDDLATINGGVDGDILEITPYASTPITIKDVHGSGGDNIELAIYGQDLVLNAPGEWLRLRSTGGTWVETGRAKWKLSQLVGTGAVIPYSPTLVKAGTLTNGLVIADFDASFAFILRRARGRVGTAPSGGSCIIQVRKNGANIFAADANAINIATGTMTDTSDLISASFVVGDRVTIICTTANSAADAGVTLEAYMEATAQP